MPQIIFVTGTDTGVGKTLATAVLAKHFKDLKNFVAVIKPIQTGRPDDDMQTVTQLAGLNTGDVYTLLRYKPALAPEQAAKVSKQLLPDYKKLLQQIRDIAWNYDVTLVEGSGGLYVPIDEQHYMLDLCKDLRSKCVLVARSGLGTINHALLSINALRAKHIKVLGIIFSTTTKTADISTKLNPRVISAKTKVPVLGVFPYQKKIDIMKLKVRVSY